jgi:hypothetical protein
MQTWSEIIDASNIAPDGLYFFAKKTGSGIHESVMFYSRLLSGKCQWSHKPGIALRFAGSDMIEMLGKYPDRVAVKVPVDADKRWKRRKPAY